MEKIAILVDGGFYRRSALRFWGEKTPSNRAKELIDYCYNHVNIEGDSLYRIFYYDCLPSGKKVYHPLTDSTFDFKKTELFTWMHEFIEELKTKRHVAIRLGVLSDEQAYFILRPDVVKDLCRKKRTVEDLTLSDFKASVAQKGVDMKIGVDIASLAYKQQVSKIVLISGDSDFVPAAKLARREGIDFILDPMANNIKPDLSEHIDGLRYFCGTSKKKNAYKQRIDRNRKRMNRKNNE